MKQKVTGFGFDMASSPLYRIFHHYLLSRVIPMGMYRGGAGLKCLLVMSMSTYLGQPLFWVATRFERQIASIRRIQMKRRF